MFRGKTRRPGDSLLSRAGFQCKQFYGCAFFYVISDRRGEILVVSSPQRERQQAACQRAGGLWGQLSHCHLLTNDRAIWPPIWPIRGWGHKAWARVAGLVTASRLIMDLDKLISSHSGHWDTGTGRPRPGSARGVAELRQYISFLDFILMKVYWNFLASALSSTM